MRNSIIQSLLTYCVCSFCVSCWMLPTLYADEWVGRKFMPRSNAKYMQKSTEIPAEEIGLPLEITETNGEWLWVGNAWVKKEHVVSLEDAPIYYTEYLKSNPMSTWAYNARGLSWEHKAEIENAIKDYTEAIRIDPSNFLAFNNRGIIWADKDEYEKAIKDYTEAIRLKPDYATTYNNRAVSLNSIGEHEKAFQDCTEAIRLRPDYHLPYNTRGNTWKYKKEYEKAIKDYSEAIRLRPDYYLPYYNRGLAKYLLGKYDDAILDYTECLRLNPLHKWAFNNRGSAWEHAKNYEKAIKDYSEAVRINPAFVTAQNNLSWISATCADASYRNGKLAVEAGTKACELTDWKDANIIDTLAAAYAELGDFEKAVKYQNMCIEMLDKKIDQTGYQERLKLYQAGKPYREAAEESNTN